MQKYIREYLLSCFCVGALFMPAGLSAQIHVSTNGSDSNAGSVEAPLQTIQHAVDVAQPGDTIWVHAGRYLISECIRIPQKQTSEQQRCYLWAADGEVIIDASAMNHSTISAFKGGRCMYLNHRANYWHFKGLTMCNAEDNGMKIEGSYNIVEQCVFHDNNDTGLQIGMTMALSSDDVPADFPVGLPYANPDYQFCRGNIVINCDAYNNANLRKYNGAEDDGGNADGFACKLYPGPGTEFHGCRAWNNSDDNWDLYMVYHPVLIETCWAYHAGYTPDGKAIGNGNGFKLGGGGSSGGAAFPRSVGAHVVRNCVAFDNLVRGFDQNYASEGVYLFNNTAWGNAYNYGFPDPLVHGWHVVHNCIGFGATERNHVFRTSDIKYSVVPENLDGNSWNIFDQCNPYVDGERNAEGKKVRAADYSQEFVSLSVSDFMAPRQADGSLPDNGFARLKQNSIMRDKGQVVSDFTPARFAPADCPDGDGKNVLGRVSISYNGVSPDLGAYETCDSKSDNSSYRK